MKKIIVSIVVVIVIFLGLIAYTQRERVEQYVIGYIAEQIKEQTGCDVEFANVHFAYPLHLEIGKVHLCEDEHPIFHIKELTVSVNPLQLLRKKIIFTEVKAKSVQFLGVSPETPVVVSWNLIPGYLKIENLDIEQFSIDSALLNLWQLQDYAELLGKDSPISIKGLGAFDAFQRSLFFDVTFAKSVRNAPTTHVIGTFSQNNGQYQVQLRIQEPNLGIIAQYVKLPEGYSLQGTLQAEGIPNSTFTGDFLVNYSAVDQNLTSDKYILGKYGSLKGPFIWFAGRGFTLPRVDGLIGPLLLHGACALSPKGLCDGTTVNLKVHDTSMLDPFGISCGPIQAECTLSGSVYSPVVAVKLQTDKLRVRELQIGNLWLKTEMTADTKVGLLNFARIQADTGGTEITGDLTYDIMQEGIIGELHGNSNLQLVRTAFNQDIQGEAVFQANFAYHPLDQGQVIDIRLQSPMLRIADLAADQVLLTTRFHGLHTQPSTAITFGCKQARYHQHYVEKVFAQTTLNRDSKEWPFTISCQSEMLQLQTVGSWFHKYSAWDLSLTTFKGSAGKGKFPFELDKTVAFRLDTNAITLSPFALKIGQGTIHASIKYGSGSTDMSVRVQKIPFDLLRLIYPSILVDGMVSADIELEQTQSGVTGHLQVDLRDLDLLQNSLSGPVNASFGANLHADVLSCKGQIRGMGPLPIDFTASLPFGVALAPPALEIDRNKSIAAHLAMQGKIESILELFLPTTSTTLTGDTQVNVDISGTLALPEVNGTVDLVNGTFELLDIGAGVKNVVGHAVIVGSQVTVNSLNAVGKDGSGKLIGTGTATLNPEQGFPFVLDFQLNKISFVPFDYANATGSGNIRFKGSTQGAVVEGKIVSDALQVIIPNKIPDAFQTVEVTYINQPEIGRLPTKISAKKASWPIALDLDIEVPHQGMVKGGDWNSEWKGSFKIMGSTYAMQLLGACHIIRGEYRLNGKSFEIREGTITLAGDPEKKTSLYVIASKDLDAIKADVILKGPIKKPSLTFRSNPPLPQREIISWILFNRGTSDITSFQGTQLNESITNLGTGNSNPDMLTKIKNQIGVDRIDINRGENEASNEVSVQVGKYLSHGVYVSVNKSVTAEANRLAIEAELLKNVKVQAEVGDDAEGLLLLKWKHDY